MGDGTNTDRLIPTTVNISGVTALAAGGEHSLALKDGKVYAWGRNDQGQLGDGSVPVGHSAPALVPGLDGMTQIAAGASHSLALDDTGNVWAWGMNAAGQLGDNSTDKRSAPVQVITGGVTEWVAAISAGAYHSLAVKNVGTVWAWGSNYHGQLGEGTRTDRLIPTAVNISGVAAVSGGEKHSIALKTDGTVWAWGSNGKGQLGRNGNESLKPVQVQQTGGSKPLTGVSAISAGALRNLALKSGTVWSWGYDQSGQLGDNATKLDQTRAVPVSRLTGIVSVAAGGYHSLATTGSELWVWGGNWLGQLGDGTTNQQSRPTKLLGPAANVTALGGGVWAKHTLIAQ